MASQAQKDQFPFIVRQNKTLLFKACNSCSHNVERYFDLAQEVIVLLERIFWRRTTQQLQQQFAINLKIMIMELEKSKSLGSDDDKKLDKNLSLNKELFTRINFDKALLKVRILFVYKLLEMLFFVYCIGWLTDQVINYFGAHRFGIPAIILDLIVWLALMADVRQIILIVKIQAKKHTDAIAPLQKLVEAVKMRIVGFVRCCYLAIPLYPLMLIVGGKVFFQIDFFSQPHLRYLEANILLAICLAPLVLIAFRKLGKQNMKNKIFNDLMQGTGFQIINKTENFLDEIVRLNANSEIF